MIITSFNHTALRTTLLIAISITLAHCSIIPDRSDETRLYLDTPDNFNRFKLSGNKSAEKEKTQGTDHVSEVRNDKKIEAATDNGAILIYRSSSAEKNPKVQYATKFLTEHPSLQPLRSKEGEAYTLLDLYEKSSEIVFPGGSDAGSYFFHRDAALSGTSNLVFSLPDTGLDKFGLDEAHWNSVKSTLQKSCSEPVESLMIQSQVKFDLSEISFQDFVVGMEFLAEAYEDLENDKVKFEHLDPGIKSELGDAFDPSIVESQSNVSSFVIICPDQTPKAWRINQDQYSDSDNLSIENNLLTMVFTHTVDRDYLEGIDLNDDTSLLGLVLKSADDKNLNVFTREQYIQYEEINMPSISDVAHDIRERRKSGTPETTETVTFDQPVESNNAQASSGDGYSELQKQILSKPKRNSRPSDTTTSTNRQGNQTSQNSSKRKAPTKQKVDIVAGNDDVYASTIASVEEWHPSLSQNDDPFFTTILRRVSDVFYEEDGQYIPDHSEFLYDVNGGNFTPNSMMWKPQYFTNTDVLSDSQANQLCDQYPLSRTISVNTSVFEPREAYDPTYLQVPSGDGSTIGKSLSDVVLDQLWVDARPTNAKYKEDQDSEKVQDTDDKKKLNLAAIQMIVYGSFAHRDDLEIDPLKNQQKMDLKFCINPASGEYQILWKSEETELQWNRNVDWDYKFVKKPDYIQNALAGNFILDKDEQIDYDKNPLIPNDKPWFKATKDVIIDTQGEAYQSFLSLANGSPYKQTLLNRGTKSPTQVKIVCADNVKKCYLVFEATIMRGLNPAILSFYMTPPTLLSKDYRDMVQNTVIPHKVIYSEMLKRMVKTYYEEGLARKNEFTIYGAIEIDELDVANKQVRYWSLEDLARENIFIAKDKEIYNDGTVYFVGETPDLYLTTMIEDASGIPLEGVTASK